MPDEAVRVRGLAEFRKELKKLDLLNDLKDANFEVGELVVRAGTRRAQSLGALEAKAVESLRANRQAAKAAVTLGGARYPFALGAEYGALRFKQFREWRGSGEGAGYFLWPSIRAERGSIIDTYGDAVERLMARAFPD